MTAIEKVQEMVLENFMADHCPSEFEADTEMSVKCNREEHDKDDCLLFIKNGTCRKCWESEVLDL